MLPKKINKKASTIVKKPVVKRKSAKQINVVAPSSTPLIKHESNPIITPDANNSWEAWQTFNPSAILINDKVHFLYRAIGQDGISRFGYAASNDGFVINERHFSPAYTHNIRQRASFNVFSYFSGGSFGGAEDPRIVRIDNEDILYMTYTACDQGLRVALTSINLQDFLDKKWNWKPPILISPPDEVHKNWVIFPEKIYGKYAVLHSINPEISIEYFDSLNELDGNNFIQSHYGGQLRKNCWDAWVRGAGPPPIKTEYGWLVFYHAMIANDFSKYKVGAMLLDTNDPTKVLARSPEPILEPDQIYENNGFKAGVVYASGAVIKNGTLLVYYGASDSYVCVAYADASIFINELRQGTKPKLQSKIFKKKII